MVLLGLRLLLQSHVKQKSLYVFESSSIELFCPLPLVPEDIYQLHGHQVTLVPGPLSSTLLLSFK